MKVGDKVTVKANTLVSPGRKGIILQLIRYSVKNDPKSQVWQILFPATATLPEATYCYNEHTLELENRQKTFEFGDE